MSLVRMPLSAVAVPRGRSTSLRPELRSLRLHFSNDDKPSDLYG